MIVPRWGTIRVGIGINSGALMLGTVGGESRMDGTVISDAVNLASRVESMTKIYGALLLISERADVRPTTRSIRIYDSDHRTGEGEGQVRGGCGL